MAHANHSYDIDQVRERTDLLALVGQYVALKKRGGRYIGLCPFHQEKTPSFGVDPAKGFWHCFGCGKGGDAFKFLMETEHLSFGEALERLAERAGVQPTIDESAPRRKEERDFLFEVNAAAAGAFSAALRGKAGEAARAYLEGRGITAEQAERFGLGLAPQTWDALINHLTGRGYAQEIIVKAGLALPRSSGSGHIDRFRNRLMIPICDRQGRVIAFGGRAMSPEDQPKYLNTAETLIFHKSRTLYALHLANSVIHQRGRAIVTEGYFDVIACHLAGFSETIATLGTALGEDHVQMLRRLAERVYLVFDDDSAGLKAALRSQALFRDAGVDVRIVRLPGGHDPDTFLRQEGAEAFERCLQEALTPVTFEFTQLMAKFPSRDAESRMQAFKEGAKILRPLTPLERSEYALWFIERWMGGTRGDLSGLQSAFLREVTLLERNSRPNYSPRVEPPAAPRAHYQEEPLEREALTAIVQDPQLVVKAMEIIPAGAFSHPVYHRIYAALLKQARSGAAPDIRGIVFEDEEAAAALAGLAIRALPAENFSTADILERLRQEYDAREAGESAPDVARQVESLLGAQGSDPPDLSNPDLIRAWTEKQRNRAKNAQRRIIGEDQ